MVSRTSLFEKSTQVSQLGGQIQLWQFLLEILTDKKFESIIRWIDDDWEFKLVQPDAVAKVWGERKNNPNMTFQKLGRALRLYYGREVVTKVEGKKHVYKFVCDMKMLLGYDFQDLKELIYGEQGSS